MVRIDRVTTRSGDGGTTRLADGTELSKASPLIIAIGEVDAANCALGAARAQAQADELVAAVALFQNDLFDLGADLATPLDGPHEAHIPRIGEGHLVRIEQALLRVGEGLEPLTSFVLPAGDPAAIAWHQARVAVRAAERALVAAREATHGRSVGPMLAYMNRLGDWCFQAARRCNDSGRDDVLWQPGGR